MKHRVEILDVQYVLRRFHKWLWGPKLIIYQKGGDFKYPVRVAFHLVESIKTRADVEAVTRPLTVPAS